MPVAADGVYVTEQLALVDVGLARLQLTEGLNEPAAPLAELAVSRAKVTVPTPPVCVKVTAL